MVAIRSIMIFRSGHIEFLCEYLKSQRLVLRRLALANLALFYVNPAMAFTFEVQRSSGVNFRTEDANGVLQIPSNSFNKISPGQRFSINESSLPASLRNLNLENSQDQRRLENWARTQSGSLKKFGTQGKYDFFVPVIAHVAATPNSEAKNIEGHVAIRWLMRNRGAKPVIESNGANGSSPQTEAAEPCSENCATTQGDVASTASTIAGIAAEAAEADAKPTASPTTPQGNSWQTYKQFYNERVKESVHFAAACGSTRRVNSTSVTALKNDFMKAILADLPKYGEEFIFDSLAGLTAFGEARSENDHEMAATIKVISNRSATRFRATGKSKSYNASPFTKNLRRSLPPGTNLDSLPTVFVETLARGQFSPWNGGPALQNLLCSDPNSLASWRGEGEHIERAMRLSASVRTGAIEFSGGLERPNSRHFYAPKSMPRDANGNRRNPPWARGKTILPAGVKLPGETSFRRITVQKFYGF